MGPRAGTFAIAVRKQTARIFSRRLNEEKRMHFLKSASRGGLGPGRGGGGREVGSDPIGWFAC